MNEIIENGRLLMDDCITSFKERLGTLRTGRASAGMLHGITVEYYGTETPLDQLGSITVNEGTQLVIKLFDPASLKDVEHTINESHLGLLAQNDGKVIRINVPSLTEDTRRSLSKNVSVFAEEAKVAVRNVRRDLNDEVKKTDNLPEDQEKGLLEDIQKLTDSFIKMIDDVSKDKVKDIMTI